MGQSGHKRSRWWIAGAIGALALAAAVWAGVWIWPWLSLPASEETIESRWERVQAWAEPTGGVGDEEILRRALAELDAEAPGPPRGPSADDADVLPHLPPEEVPDSAQRALSLLESWHEDGGGIEFCDLDRDLIGVMALGRWAIATADSDDDLVRARAVARLADSLRRSGSLLDAAIGIALTRDLLRWHVTRGVPSEPILDDLAPRDGEWFRARAQDAVCWLQFARQSGEDGLGEPDDPPFGIVSFERELAMLKWYYGDLLTRAREHRGAPNALEAFFEREWREFERDPPPSVLVRLVHATPREDVWRDFRSEWSRLRPEADSQGYAFGACEIAEEPKPCAERCADRGLRCAPYCSAGPAVFWPGHDECAPLEDGLSRACDDEPPRQGTPLRCCCGPPLPEEPEQTQAPSE